MKGLARGIYQMIRIDRIMSAKADMGYKYENPFI